MRPRRLFPPAGLPAEGRHSLHNHSQYSDGGATLRETAFAAKRAGLRYFGISDHYTRHPELGELYWSLKTADLPAYFAEIAELKAELNDADFSLLAGLELDYFPENHAETMAGLKKYPLDYLIGSVHFCGRFALDESADDYEKLTPEALVELWRENFRLLEQAAATADFDWLGHLDLAKKFTGLPENLPLADLAAVLDACRRTGTAIEFNTSGWDKPCRDAYPAKKLLVLARDRQIPVVVTSDSHRAADLTRHFDRAQRELQTLGMAPAGI